MPQWFDQRGRDMRTLDDRRREDAQHVQQTVRQAGCQMAPLIDRSQARKLNE